MKPEWLTLGTLALGLATVAALVIFGHQTLAAAVGGVLAVTAAQMPQAVRKKLPSERDTDPEGVS